MAHIGDVDFWDQYIAFLKEWVAPLVSKEKNMLKLLTKSKIIIIMEPYDKL